MRRFIQLTKARTGSVVMIDADLIRCIEQIEDRVSETRTRIVTAQEDWYVSEDYRTVMERMDELYNHYT